MSPSHEARLLRKLLKRLDHGLQPSRFGKWGLVIGWLLLAAFFFALLRLGDNANRLAISLISMGIGALLAVLTIRGAAAAQWPSLYPHLNRESIAARLRQLEP